ncbi:MAG TPA: Mut7-C RNAse domain-containing protein [Longimicrobiales bacterium]|nr:Mut7-C RNAse domain-containing protein [Longimicrobiales bacterium]
MAVPCPRCGREYDVTLFQFGRTIHCTCGARVGLEKRIRLPDDAKPPTFAVDAMLGGLARWLRILGYDTAYDPRIEDEALVRRSAEEGRWILTRDARLPREWTVEGYLLLEADEPLDQLREVVERLALRPREEHAFTRCPGCNGFLEQVDAAEVEDEVPERVLARHSVFRRCPGCGQVYWEGSHVGRIRERIGDLLE